MNREQAESRMSHYLDIGEKDLASMFKSILRLLDVQESLKTEDF